MKTLTGQEFARAVQAGTLVVLRERATLDEINVFPVADADTGSNLAATLSAAASRLGQSPPIGVGEAVRVAAEAALDGARGNSGAIIAQFLQGLAEGIGGKVQVTTREFALAARRAVEAAYQALQEPVKGTILSVIRDWASAISEHAPRVEDFRDLFDRALERARTALANTPRQLEVLSRNRVVDAGGQGFVYFLEGLSAAVAGKVTGGWQHVHSIVRRDHTKAVQTDIDTSLRYCAEGLIVGQGLDRKAIKHSISDLGRSIVIAGTAQRLRVHIHTNDPASFFAVLAQFGALVETKADDMIAQQLSKSEATVALVTDSTCDLPGGSDELLNLSRVPLAVTLGDQVFLDGVDIDAEELVSLVSRERLVSRTSQPSVGSFIKLYRQLLEVYETVVSIHISSLLSGTYQAACMAAQQVAADRIAVVDSRHTSVGLGMIVEAAAEAAARGEDLEGVLRAAETARADVRMYGTVQALDWAVRGGRVDRRVAAVADLLSLKPIVVFNGDGRANIDGAKPGLQRALRALVQRAKEFARDSAVQLAVVHAAAPEVGKSLADLARETFGGEEVPIVPAGVVLTTHVGPGCVTLAVRKLRFA